VKGTPSEVKPAEVAKPKQAGEIWARWPWVERAVWTDRMLAALETGVKGGKWFSLMDKDHHRWPNSFFREAGLYSMQEARALLCRPR
jgi:hypothetical protein